ncbi:Glyceraldehyde/Erythrose phosphate dehydrogenase family [Phytophthora cactorum]|nr:Glyceraldehyde/Erythrose phosphate dehydrogenase family [Phytophthora cactorum]
MSPCPAEISSGKAGATYLCESTALFRTAEKDQIHIEGGCKKDSTPTYMMGVNHKDYDGSPPVVSNASYTTNCLAPLAKMVNDKLGIVEGDDGHATTATLLPDWRGGRGCGQIIIPSAPIDEIVGKVLPVLNGKHRDMAAVKAASEGELAGILTYKEDQVVSNDFLHDKRSIMFDADVCIALNDNFVTHVSCGTTTSEATRTVPGRDERPKL